MHVPAEMPRGIAKSQIRKQIIAAILEEYDISEWTLFGRMQTDYVVDARMDAAGRLKAAGFSVCHIARVLNRDHTTISYYFNGKFRKNKRDYMRLRRRRSLLPDDVKAVVDEFAERQNTTPAMILSEWIIERARCEIETRLRDQRTAA